MPSAPLYATVQFETVQPSLVEMPRAEFWYAEQFVTVASPPALMPCPVLKEASTPSMRQLIAEAVARSMPSPPQERTEPLSTAMLDWMLAAVTLTPSSEPGAPRRSKPLRSRVTPLATISTPCLPDTPWTLPVR